MTPAIAPQWPQAVQDDGLDLPFDPATPLVIPVDGHPKGPWDGLAGRCVVCVGTRAGLHAFVGGVLKKGQAGSAEIDRHCRRFLAARRLRTLRTRLLGTRPEEARTATVRYRHRILARLALDPSLPDPAAVAFPYFGEPLDRTQFRLNVDPPVAGVNAVIAVIAVIIVQQPQFSALERFIQRCVPGANPGDGLAAPSRSAAMRRRFLVYGEWATEDWLVRSATEAERARPWL